MPAGKRNNVQLERDRDYSWGEYLKGVPVQEINKRVNARAQAENLGYTISRPVTYDDITARLAEYRKESEAVLNDQVQIELAKVNKLEQEYWEAWERSKTAKRRTEIEGGEMVGSNITGGTVKKRTTEQIFGDPRYLEGVQWCIERRCRMLGLDQPLEINANMTLYQYVKDLAQSEAMPKAKTKG